MDLTRPFSLALVVIVAPSLLGVPGGHAMIGDSILHLLLKGMDMGKVEEQLLNGTNSSFLLLLAIPLFILAASIMSSGSILKRLLRFCYAIVSRFPGGLAQVNALQGVVFASMSGSALADEAGSGRTMQALMLVLGAEDHAHRTLLDLGEAFGAFSCRLHSQSKEPPQDSQDSGRFSLVIVPPLQAPRWLYRASEARTQPVAA